VYDCIILYHKYLNYILTFSTQRGCLT